MPKKSYDAVVVGAGPAGVGTSVMLQQLGVSTLLLDRHEVGASFARWPKEMRLITPSFPTNSVGMLDLNSIALGTSPGYSFRKEHLSGLEYATYLQSVAAHYRLKTRLGINVHAVLEDVDGGFHVETDAGTYHASQLVWAGGEFQYPRRAPFPGAELARHNATVTSWSELEGDDFIIVGGYESGIDSAVNLVRLGKRVRLLDRTFQTGENVSSDPSSALSPYTFARLAAAQASRRLELIEGADVVRIERTAKLYTLHDRNGNTWRSRTQPILATGFEGSLRLLHDLFEWRSDGQPHLNDHDESTATAGLFVAGPAVRHAGHVFCFIYKFRQRFAVVAARIAARLGIDASPLEEYRKWGMYLDDLSCCGQECVC